MGVKDKLRELGKRRTVRYAASLPERIVRSASALTAGTLREIATVALPIGLRRGHLYRGLVDVALQFLIEDVGGVPPTAGNEQKLGEDFLLRRAAGNGIELMGIVAFRASPVWVLAALADVAGFGRQLIPEIAAALEKEGLLAPGERFATMEQLLQRPRAQLRTARRDRKRAAARCGRIAPRVGEVRHRGTRAAGAAVALGDRGDLGMAGHPRDGRARATLDIRSVVRARTVGRQRVAGARARPLEVSRHRAAARRRRTIERACSSITDSR